MMVDRLKAGGMQRLSRACAYSWRGLKAAWSEERAFREEVVLAALAIPAGCYLGRTGLERAALVAPVMLILIVELLNSSLEAVVDRMSLERDSLAAMAKDMGSAAVFLSLAGSFVVWVLVLTDR